MGGLPVEVLDGGTARPAVQGEQVGAASAPLFGQEDLPVVPVTRRKGLAVDIHQGLRMAKLRRVADRQVEGYRCVPLPVRGDLESSAQHKVQTRLCPLAFPGDGGPVLVLDIQGHRRTGLGTRELQQAEGIQAVAARVGEGPDQLDPLSDLLRGETDLVEHGHRVILDRS